MNSTALNDSLEFPLWMPLTAVNLILFIGVLLPTTLLMNISVLAALIKSKVKHKPLLVLFGSLLVGVCIDKLLVCVDQCVNSPATIRYCHCTTWMIVLLQAPRAFFTVYSIVAVTCLSVAQLLTMKGKQNGYKQSFFFVTITALVAIFWTVVYTITNGLARYPLFCHTFCEGYDSPEGRNVVSDFFIAIIIFLIFTMTPAFIVTILTSIETVRIFKRSFIVRSENRIETALNRRMILLPVLMAVLLVCNSILSFFSTTFTGLILKQAGVEAFYGNWANIMAKYEFLILDMVHSLSFPLVLLYLYTNVRNTWKKLFLCKNKQ